MPHRWPAGWSPEPFVAEKPESKPAMPAMPPCGGIGGMDFSKAACLFSLERTRLRLPRAGALLRRNNTRRSRGDAGRRYVISAFTAAGRLLVVAPRQRRLRPNRTGFRSNEATRPLRRHRGGTVGQQHTGHFSALARDGDHTPELAAATWNRLVIASLSPLATRNRTSRCHFLFPSSTRRRTKPRPR